MAATVKKLVFFFILQARTTAHVTHEIINSDVNPTLITEVCNCIFKQLIINDDNEGGF